MAGLVELVGVERETEADGGASVELGAVGEGGDAAVVDLGLLLSSVRDRGIDWKYARLALAKERASSLYFDASSRPLAFCAWTS